MWVNGTDVFAVGISKAVATSKTRMRSFMENIVNQENTEPSSLVQILFNIHHVYTINNVFLLIPISE